MCDYLTSTQERVKFVLLKRNTKLASGLRNFKIVWTECCCLTVCLFDDSVYRRTGVMTDRHRTMKVMHNYQLHYSYLSQNITSVAKLMNMRQAVRVAGMVEITN
jgi:hypothetical protein